jgi:predicted acylesterase/phospholipase RssA
VLAILLLWTPDCTMAKREQTVLVLQGGGALGAYQAGV